MTAKKTTKKAPKSIPTFKERLSAISRAVQSLPVTGQAKDGSYWYDRASEIFPIFNTLFHEHQILPPRLVDEKKQIVAFGGYPAYELTCIYVIEDVHSDESITIMGSGSAFNREWSLDAAHTWVLKRALKDAFLAACEQPEEMITSDETFDLPFGIGLMQRSAKDMRDEFDKFIDGLKEGQKAPQATAETPAEIVPTPQMSRPGNLQEARIQVICDHFKGIYELAKVAYDDKLVRQAIWTYFGNRWPKSDQEVEEAKLNISC